VSSIDPVLQSIAAQLPPSCSTTEELLSAAGDRLSDKLRLMLGSLGVESRYSVLRNFPDVLFGGAAPELAVPASTLAAQAARSCLERADIDPGKIGLVLGVTSSPARLLPSMVCDLLALMPEIPRDVATLSVSYMGCSAIAKVVEAARWYLTVNPGKRVLACFMDAITPLSPPLPGTYQHFSEIDPLRRQDTVNVMHGFLFGDAAVAMVLGAEGVGPTFGPVVHLTNERPEDTELGTVPDGGSDLPIVQGRRLYTLSADVTPRGAFYTSQTVQALLARDDCRLAKAGEATALLLHTGSHRILDKLCETFGVLSDGPQMASSYAVLRNYGNTIGCSVPLMLAEDVERPAGEALLVAFGLSFSCGAFTMTVPAGGWRPGRF